MPIIINAGSWKFWAAVIVVVLIIMWIFWGGKKDMEVVGLNPLLAPTAQSSQAGHTTMMTRSHSIRITRPLEDELPSTSRCITPTHKEEEPEEPRRKFKSIGEELACTAMEQIMGRSVMTGVRPSHLRNPKTGRNLEYDCWDPVSKIAVEYDGQQHYKYTPRYHKSHEDFEQQVQRDQLKVALSAQHGINLIKIPYTVDVCDIDRNNPEGFRYNSKITKTERYQRIYKFLYDKIRSDTGIISALHQE